MTGKSLDKSCDFFTQLGKQFTDSDYFPCHFVTFPINLNFDQQKKSIHYSTSLFAFFMILPNYIHFSFYKSFFKYKKKWFDISEDFNGERLF